MHEAPFQVLAHILQHLVCKKSQADTDTPTRNINNNFGMLEGTRVLCCSWGGVDKSEVLNQWKGSGGQVYSEGG